MLDNISNTLREAREETHRVVQIVGSFPRSFLPHDPSDASSSLIWNDEISGFESQDVDGFKVAFSLIDQAVLLLKGGVIDSSIDTVDQTFDSVFKAFAAEIGNLGFNSESLSASLPYELPETVTKRGTPFVRQEPAALRKMAELYSFTQSILSEVFLDVKEASDIRCWPHHYDLATLVTIDAHEDSEKAKSIGFGFSPGDGGYDEPYFYLTPWPYPSIDDLYELTEPAFWNTKGWTGGVLKALDIPLGEEKMIITDFFESGFEKLKPIL